MGDRLRANAARARKIVGARLRLIAEGTRSSAKRSAATALCVLMRNDIAFLEAAYAVIRPVATACR